MEYGNWDGHHKDDHSNVKELTNLVIAVENAYAKGLLSWWDPGYGPLTEMTCDDWFEKTMDGGNFLWNVPPAAGEVAVEQLCTHRHRRPDSMHVFIIPRLYTSQFRKQLLKVADLELVIQPDHAFWTKEMHEPLLIAFCFPLLPHDRRFAPWRLKETEMVDRVGRYVRRMQQE
eukprot:scaffold4424_cov137-Chaetoceros_neogracile.AAC.1